MSSEIYFRLLKTASQSHRPRTTDRWPSGRRRTPGKCVGGRPSPGFESLSVRHVNIINSFKKVYYHKYLIINKILKILPPIYPPPWLGLSRNMSDKATFWAKNCFQRRGPATSATLLHEKPNDARGGPDRGGHQKYETGHSPDFPCVQKLRE
jgi:hypothetical protein